MNIPEKAVQAGFKAAQADGGYATSYTVEAILEAAAPFIVAQALRNLANSAEGRSPDDGVSPHWIRRVAIVVQESAE